MTASPEREKMPMLGLTREFARNALLFRLEEDDDSLADLLVGDDAAPDLGRQREPVDSW